MFLTKAEERMLNGEYGPGIRRSMELLVKLGEAFDAERMIMAQSAHIHCAVSLDLLSGLTEGATQCRVITTTHPNAYPNVLDPTGWTEKKTVQALLSNRPTPQKLLKST